MKEARTARYSALHIEMKQGKRGECWIFAKAVRVLEARTARYSALHIEMKQGKRGECWIFAKAVRVLEARTARYLPRTPLIQPAARLTGDFCLFMAV